MIYLFLLKGKVDPKDLQNAISSAWRDSGLDNSVGTLTTYAEDIRRDYRSIDQMLRVPKERASFGEIAMEHILSDQLPPDMFGMRKRILDGKFPDAHILSPVGQICIDSKFPLDNYRLMLEEEKLEEKEKFKKQFLRDVQGHLGKIAEDYVCPEKGSAEFAFAFIPSESVYYFLVTEAYDTLRSFTSRGVQVVSPLTLSHKIELIKAGVHAKRLTEQAENVREDISRLGQQFKKLDSDWQKFYTNHLRNASRTADDLDRDYQAIREEYNRISRFSGGKEEQSDSSS